MKTLRFRPHHFLCALGFQGKGYSDAFTANMNDIVNGRLRAPEGDDVKIVVTRHTDSICTPCPKRQGTQCQNQEGIETLDNRHRRWLGLRFGQVVTWGDAKEKIRLRTRPGDLKTICDGCQWLTYGMCENAVRELHNTPIPPKGNT